MTDALHAETPHTGSFRVRSIYTATRLYRPRRQTATKHGRRHCNAKK